MKDVSVQSVLGFGMKSRTKYKLMFLLCFVYVKEAFTEPTYPTPTPEEPRQFFEEFRPRLTRMMLPMNLIGFRVYLNPKSM